MKKLYGIFICRLLMLSLAACARADAEQESVEVITRQSTDHQSIDHHSTEDFDMKLFINEVEIPVSWENCTAVDELMGLYKTW